MKKASESVNNIVEIPTKNLYLVDTGKFIQECIMKMRFNDRACFCISTVLNTIQLSKQQSNLFNLPAEIETIDESIHRLLGFAYLSLISYPLINEANRKYLQFYETGHIISNSMLDEFVKKIRKYIKIRKGYDDYCSDISAVPLVFVIMVGLATASVVFVFEMMIWHININQHYKALKYRAHSLKRAMTRKWNSISRSLKRILS